MKRCNRQEFRALKTVATEAKRLLVDHLCVEEVQNTTARVTANKLAQVSNAELDRLFRACSHAERAGVDLGVGPPLSSSVLTRSPGHEMRTARRTETTQYPEGRTPREHESAVGV